MDKCFVFAGLFLNLIGVILIFPGIKADKHGTKFYSREDDGSLRRSYAAQFNLWFLYSGLFCLIVGIILQMVGIYLSTIP